MIVFAVVLICLGIIGLMKYLRMRRHGVAASAKVTEIKRSIGTRNKCDNVFMAFRTENGQQMTARLVNSKRATRLRLYT